MTRVRERMKLVIRSRWSSSSCSCTQHRSDGEAGIVMLRCLLRRRRGVAALGCLGYNMSMRVVGMIALAGLDAETGVSCSSSRPRARRGRACRRLGDRRRLWWRRIVHGAVKRADEGDDGARRRLVGLMPFRWSQGTGAAMMKRIAARWWAAWSTRSRWAAV